MMWPARVGEEAGLADSFDREKLVNRKLRRYDVRDPLVWDLVFQV